MATKARPRTHTAPNNQVSDRTDAALTTLVERLSSRRSLHHVNLAVASTDGRHRWAGAAGPERTDGPQARPEAPFFIASITKRFIITLVLQAHERGELDLDVPITAYLPRSVTHRLHMHQGVDRTPQITVRHLASHTSGLPDFFEHRHEGQSLHQQLRAGRDSSWTFDDAIAANRQQRTLFAPQDLSANSQRARYSDTGFLLLIHLLQTVTATPFAELLTARIAVPLGLTRTWHPAATPGAMDLPTPLPLHARRRPVNIDGIIASSHDLYSTTDDLLTFERALWVGEPFADSRTRLLLTERQNRLRNAPGLRYGLGTMVFTVNRLMLPRRAPVTLIGHSGATGTWLFTCPELGVHLTGTIDQTQAYQLPFWIMAHCLRIWTADADRTAVSDERSRG